MQPPPCPTVSAKEAAEFLGMKEQTLAVWRSSRRHPLPFIRIGRRIRYRITELETFLTQNTER
jgi:excisionase family DNA binding protein